VDLLSLGRFIKEKLNVFFHDVDSIDHIIIEEQMAPKMKNVQGMLVQYFIMTNINIGNIQFISSSYKLKDVSKDEKTKYSNRKKIGISKCLEYLTNNQQYSGQMGYFNSHSKKDDLADSFLQGIWFITHL
jgi:hypothetical protein